MPYDPNEPYREADEADRLLRELLEQEQGKIDEQAGMEDLSARYSGGEENLTPGLESFSRQRVAQSRYKTKSELGKAIALKRFRVRQQAKEKSKVYGELNRQEQEAKKSARRKALMNVLGTVAGAGMTLIPGVGPALGLAKASGIGGKLVNALKGAGMARGMGGMFGYGTEKGTDPLTALYMRRAAGASAKPFDIGRSMYGSMFGEGEELSPEEEQMLSSLTPEDLQNIFGR